MKLIDKEELIRQLNDNSQTYCNCKDCDGRGNIIRVSEVVDIMRDMPTLTESEICERFAERLKEHSIETVSGMDVVEMEVVYKTLKGMGNSN